MTIATGVAKKVRFARETNLGVKSVATPQASRRVSSDLSLSKDTYESQEIRDDYQTADARHGMRKVGGKIEGEVSPKSYSDFLSAAVRRDFTAGVSVTDTDIAATAGGFTRASGSFITSGFRVGQVIRAAGLGGGAAANNNRNFLITALAAGAIIGVFVDGTAGIARAAGDSVTLAVVGKTTHAPLTGHTDISYSIEHWHSDVTQSELFLGCKPNQVDVDLPPTGMAKISVDFLGLDMSSGTVEALPNPTAAPKTGVLAAVNGVVFAAGSKQTVLTGLKFSINGNMSSEAVVGSNIAPDIFEGRVTVKGDMSAFFENGTLRDAFIAESEVALFAVFTSSNAADADFVSFCFPRVKLNGASKDDGEKGLVQSIPFVALLGDGTNGFEETTVCIQDSAA